MTDYCQHGIYKDNECLACERDRYKAALEGVAEMIQQLPGGVDEDADESDPSPQDASAHVGGLILKLVKKALRD